MYMYTHTPLYSQDLSYPEEPSEADEGEEDMCIYIYIYIVSMYLCIHVYVCTLCIHFVCISRTYMDVLRVCVDVRICV